MVRVSKLNGDAVDTVVPLQYEDIAWARIVDVGSQLHGWPPDAITLVLLGGAVIASASELVELLRVQSDEHHVYTFVDLDKFASQRGPASAAFYDPYWWETPPHLVVRNGKFVDRCAGGGRRQ